MTKKPIRKDRVLLLAVILLGVILLPILFRSGEQPAPPVVEPPVEQGLQRDQVEEGPSVSEPPLSELPTEEKPSEEPQETTVVAPLLEHTVQPGETLAAIAGSLGVSSEQLAASNYILDPRKLAVGETLQVPQHGILHLIKPGQTLSDISLTYAVSMEEIIAANGISDPGMIYAGEELIIPGVTGSLWEGVVRLSKGEESRFIWPLLGEIVSSFGGRVHPVLGHWHLHNGVDIDVPIGSVVHAAASGNVYFSGEEEGYGTLVILEHANDFYTFYGHLSEPLVRVGQYVEAGQPIARSGNSGLSSGPHLHFEVRHNGSPLDPLRYLP